MRALHEALKNAKRASRDAARVLEDVKEDGDDPTTAAADLMAARRGVQAILGLLVPWHSVFVISIVPSTIPAQKNGSPETNFSLQ